MSKFLVSVDHESPEDVNKFAAHLSDLGYGWWHHIRNTWVIDVGISVISEVTIRDKVKIHFPDRIILVVNMQSRNWAGWGNQEQFKWMFENWK